MEKTSDTSNFGKNNPESQYLNEIAKIQNEIAKIQKFALEMGYQKTQSGLDNYKAPNELGEMLKNAAKDLSDFARETAAEKRALNNSGIRATASQSPPISVITSQPLVEPRKASVPNKYPVAPAPQTYEFDVCVDGTPHKINVYVDGDPYIET